MSATAKLDGSGELPRLTPELVRTADARLRARGVDVPGHMVLDLPERVLQFGTGMMLRGLVEDFIDRANRKGVFKGRIVAVGSANSVARDRALNEQGGLYTLVVRGAESGALHSAQSAAGMAKTRGSAPAISMPQPTRPASPRAQGAAAGIDRRIVASLSRALSSVDEWDRVLACARDPALEVIFSQETDAGIVLDESDRADLSPPRSYPGQLTRVLLERARAFRYDRAHAPVVIPCEMVDGNGDRLRAIVLELTRRWRLEPEFAFWLERWVPFCNTLVDRIVTSGSPTAEEQPAVSAELGYVDRVVTTCEPYRLLVIEAGLDMWPRLRFVGADPGIVLAEDIRPFRERKVRILNGTHSVAAPTGLLCGCETVLDAIRHPLVGPFLRRVLFDEILPTLDAPGAEQFAHDVLERFSNPEIRHFLFDISFQETTKLRVRIIPSIDRFADRSGLPPASLAFGFAAYLWFMRGDLQQARRARGLDVPRDDEGEPVRAAWRELGAERIPELVAAVCGNDELWGIDLRAVYGFVPAVTQALSAIAREGAPAALEAHLAAVGAAPPIPL